MTAPSVRQKTKRPRQSSDLKPVIDESGIEVKTLYTLEDVTVAVDHKSPPATCRSHAASTARCTGAGHGRCVSTLGFANAADTNKRFKYLIENGQTGLNVAFDLATQCGYDFDAPEALGEVGPRYGRRYPSGFRDCFRRHRSRRHHSIAYDKWGGGDLIAMYLAMAEKRGYDLAKLRGTAQNDILKEFIGRPAPGIFRFDSSVKLVADTIEYCAKIVPQI